MARKAYLKSTLPDRVAVTAPAVGSSSAATARISKRTHNVQSITHHCHRLVNRESRLCYLQLVNNHESRIYMKRTQAEALPDTRLSIQDLGSGVTGLLTCGSAQPPYHHCNPTRQQQPFRAACIRGWTKHTLPVRRRPAGWSSLASLVALCSPRPSRVYHRAVYADAKCRIDASATRTGLACGIGLARCVT